MRGKTGAARIALATGCPVVPVAQWGAQRILPPYRHWPRLLPRHVIDVRAGHPVDLRRFDGREVTADVLAEATEQVMTELTGLLSEIRGEAAPARRWDPRRSGQSLIGNPHRGNGSGRRPKRGRA